MKVLKEAYVAHNISVNKVDQLVGNIVVNNFIAFSDEEIPPERTREHKGALHHHQMQELYFT